MASRRKANYYGVEPDDGVDSDGAQTTNRKARLQVAAAAFCALAIFIGVMLNRQPKHDQEGVALSSVVKGTWQLVSVNGNKVSDPNSVVLSQEMTLGNGKVHGITHMKGETDAATVAMPFPDDTVTSVKQSADGHDVTLTWEGKYDTINRSHAEFQIGKATYRTEIQVNPTGDTIRLDNDIILTYKGAAVYQKVEKDADPNASGQEEAHK